MKITINHNNTTHSFDRVICDMRFDSSNDEITITLKDYSYEADIRINGNPLIPKLGFGQNE